MTDAGFMIHHGRLMAYALEDYCSNRCDEISLREGDIVCVLQHEVQHKRSYVSTNKGLGFLPTHVLSKPCELKEANSFHCWAGKGQIPFESVVPYAVYPTNETKRAIAVIRGLIQEDDICRVSIKVSLSRIYGMSCEGRGGQYWQIAVTSANANYTISRPLYRIPGSAWYNQDGTIGIERQPNGNLLRSERKKMGIAFGTNDVVGMEVVGDSVRFYCNYKLQGEVKPTCKRPWVFCWVTSHAAKAEIIPSPNTVSWETFSVENAATQQLIDLNDI